MDHLGGCPKDETCRYLDGRLPRELPVIPELIGATQRDERAATDTAQYYCVSATTGGLVTRGDRPLYATLLEWQSVASAVPGAVYIPVLATSPRGTAGLLFGSLPLFDGGESPDLIKRVCDLTVFLEKAAEMLGQRVGQLDQQLINGRLHERELLARAADMIDPDTGPTGFTTEQRLDWLAQWREVTTRG